MDTDENAKEVKGGLVGGYLNKRQMVALVAAYEAAEYTRAAYVQVAILEKLVRDGHLPELDAEWARNKAEFRKHFPHGNSKKYKDQVAEYLAAKEKPAPEPELTTTQRRREARRRRLAR